MTGAIRRQTVPATIIKSDWRGEGAKHTSSVAINVISRRCGCDHLNRAAGQAKGHGPERAFPGPVRNLLEGKGHDAQNPRLLPVDQFGLSP